VSRVPFACQKEKCENASDTLCGEGVRKTWEKRGRFVDELGSNDAQRQTRRLFRRPARKFTGQESSETQAGFRFANFSTNSQHSSQQQDAVSPKTNLADSCRGEGLRPVNRARSVFNEFLLHPKIPLLSRFSTAFSPLVPFILCEKTSTVR
jgi:hypothetical protein